VSNHQFITDHSSIASASEETILTGRRKLVSIMAHSPTSATTLTFKDAAGATVLVLRMATNIMHFWKAAEAIDITGLTVTPNAANSVLITVSHSRSL